MQPLTPSQYFLSSYGTIQPGAADPSWDRPRYQVGTVPRPSLGIQPPTGQSTKSPGTALGHALGAAKRSPQVQGSSDHDEEMLTPKALKDQGHSLPNRLAPLRPCTAVVEELEPDHSQQLIYRSPPDPNLPSRLEMLKLWRERTGLSGNFPDRPVGSRGGELSVKLLDTIVRHMLSDVPQGTRPRAVLWAFAASSRRFKYVAAPYIYEHVVLQGNGDAGVYARTGSANHVRSLTLQFEPHDPWNPYSTLMDQMLYPSAAKIPESGIQYLFPNCTELRFAVQHAPEEVREIYLAGAKIFGSEFGGYDPSPGRSRLYETPSYLASKLVQLIPSGVKQITLDADVPEVAARFVVGVMTRQGNPEDKVYLDLVTWRDEVVQSVEDMIHSYTPQRSDPATATTRIVIRGPSYGATITWDESAVEEAPLQGIWRLPRQSKSRASPPRGPSSPTKKPVSSTPEVYSPEAPRRSTRPSTSPYKRRIPSPMPEDDLDDRMDVDEEEEEEEPAPKAAPTRSLMSYLNLYQPLVPSAPPPGQEDAWRAGRLVAEMPSILRQTMSQVNESNPQSSSSSDEKGEYHEFWTFVDNLSEGESRVGLWHPTARAELDTFLEAYRESRIAAHAKLLRLAMLKEARDLARSQREKNEKKGSPKKRSRRG